MILKKFSNPFVFALTCLLFMAAEPVFAEEAAVEADAPEIVTESPAPAAEAPAPSSAATDSADSSTRIPVDAPLDQIKLLVVPMTVDDLAEEATAWQDVIKQLTSQVVLQKIAIEAAPDEDRERMQDQLAILMEDRRTVYAGFDAVLRSWEDKGGDADAIAAHRQYLSAIRSGQKKATDTATVWKTTRDWMFSKDGGMQLLWKLIVFLGALFLVYLLAKLVTRLVGRAMKRVEFSILLESFLTRAAFWVTLVIGALTILSWLGVRMTPLVTALGGASFVAAFAMQSTLSNFAAGLMIMIYKPFDVGNVVTVGGVTGKVREMSLVSTTLVTADNQVIVVPNSNVWGSIITNITVSDTRRVDLVFGIGYEDDEQAASKIMEEVVAAHPLVLDDPEPVVRLHELADSSVNFVCRPWVKSDDYWTVYWDITAQVKQRFDEAGISIPYPQQDVHVKMPEKPASAA